ASSSNHRRLAVDGEALGTGEGVDARRQRRRRGPWDADGRDPSPEGAGAERPREAAGAAGREDMVGARRVVAEGGGGIAAREYAAGRRHPLGEQRGVLLEQLEVLRGELVGEVDRVAEVRDLDQRQGRVGDAGALRGEPFG